MFRPEAYSEHCQTSTMERFAKNTCLAHFSAQSQKKKRKKKHPLQENFLHFLKRNKRKLFLYFRKRKSRKKFSYFLERKLFLYFGKTKTPKKFFIIQEMELSYIQNTSLTELFLYFGKVIFRTLT